jgi:Uma2 family endonuclease
MLNPRIKFTYQDYLLLPEGDRRELIHGDFYMAPSPSFRHQSISANLGMILRDYVRRNDLGIVLWAPMDVVFTDKDVVQPDILYISNERRDIITEANISGAPDLVIEILSPGTADRDRQLKLRLYARHGVREYWIVDPDERSVQIMELGPEGYDKVRSLDSGEITSNLIPGLTIGIDDVFAVL